MGKCFEIIPMSDYYDSSFPDDRAEKGQGLSPAAGIMDEGEANSCDGGN